MEPIEAAHARFKQQFGNRTPPLATGPVAPPAPPLPASLRSTSGHALPPRQPLTPAEACAIFRAQCLSRHADRLARQLQAKKQAYYTIGSSGHEGMAAVAAALTRDDIAFLHYRDAAFQLLRAAQCGAKDPIYDLMLSFVASSDDPMSGGRHKVLGSQKLNIPPQTSTIASHLPKAVGAAYSIPLANQQRPEHCVAAGDSIIICSFGDASFNHSTAQGAINAAGWHSFQNTPLPIIFVCEDNGIGISVPTPKGWIEANVSSKPGLTYIHANGLDMFATYAATQEAVSVARQHKKPVFLHLDMVRLFGHAGSDVETAYLSRETIQSWHDKDPLRESARRLCEVGYACERDILAIYNDAERDCLAAMDRAITRPKLSSAKQVMQSIIPAKRPCRAGNQPNLDDRHRLFAHEMAAMSNPQPMGRLINWALTDLMACHDEIILIGEDIGRKGGVYGITQRLQSRFGTHRVIDMLLDEQTILGHAIGMAHNGFIPIPEIQFLAYLHNAEDQLRGEAATLPFFSNRQFANPMVVRIAGLGYQRGFGGHFHNDNSLAVLRDIPGLIIACPSNGADAVTMLRECVRLAREQQRLIVFIEPIALYHSRDLLAEKDMGWTFHYPDIGHRAAFGEVATQGEPGELALVSYGNGYYLAAQARHDLAQHHQINARLIDLRWLAPLPLASLRRALSGCGHALIIDECRHSGNFAEALVTALHNDETTKIDYVAAQDSFIATGPAFATTMPARATIVEAARRLIGR